MIKSFLVKILSPIFFSLFLKKDRGLVTIGTNYPWTFNPDNLNSASHIVSAGVGGDITFELELVKRYGCQILLLDPSPTGLKTIQKLQPLPEQIDFLPVGLAGTSQTHFFSSPIDPNEGSFRLAVGSDSGGEHKWECYSIGDVVKKKGWRSIDLLKLDIECFEYNVLSKLPAREIPISQICVELHFGKEYPYRFRHVIMCILKLRLQGYKLTHRFLNDFTFIKAVPRT